MMINWEGAQSLAEHSVTPGVYGVTIDVDYNTGEDVITGLLDQKSLKGAVSLLRKMQRK